jgi:hypothetical protein
MDVLDMGHLHHEILDAQFIEVHEFIDAWICGWQTGGRHKQDCQ